MVVALLFLEAEGVGCEKIASSLWVFEPVGAVPEPVFGESFDGFDDGSADGDLPYSLDVDRDCLFVFGDQDAEKQVAVVGFDADVFGVDGAGVGGAGVGVAGVGGGVTGGVTGGFGESVLRAGVKWLRTRYWLYVIYFRYLLPFRN